MRFVNKHFPASSRHQRVPHVARGRLEAHVRAVLEGRLLDREKRLLTDYAATPHRFQRAGQTEDSPVTLPELDGQLPQVLQTDAVAPLFSNDFAALLCISVQCQSYPIDCRVLRFPAAHVEGSDRDADLLRRLLVDVGEFQPGMIPLLPSS